MAWWWNRRTLERSLIQSILESEIERRKIDAEVSAKDREIRLREKEMELANLEKIHEERRKDAADRERLRELRRGLATKARERLAQVRAERNGETTQQCPVCKNPGDPYLSPAVIMWHHNGHISVPPLS